MTAQKKRVEFKILAPDAEKVMVTGSFNKWSERSDLMKRDKTGEKEWASRERQTGGSRRDDFLPSGSNTTPYQYRLGLTRNLLFGTQQEPKQQPKHGQ